jgi:hypothetical protein
MEFVYQTGPSNTLVSSLRRNLYSGVSPDEILNSIQDGTRAYAVFNSKEKIKETLHRILIEDEGISIIVSGLIDRIREFTTEMGLDPHTVNLSLGIFGNTDLLPPPDIRQYTSMCGHGMVSPALVRDIIRKVKTKKINAWEGSLVLTTPCSCGIVNPHRAEALFNDSAPLYTVNRW